MTLRTAALACTLLLALGLSGCGDDSSPSATPATSPATSPATGLPPTVTPTIAATEISHAGPVPSSTPKLDSIVVIGHSGTTGYGTDPTDPFTDRPENSWATGTNPAVDSIYERLLATHPALKDHTFHEGIDGSDVTSLPTQVDDLLTESPMPDVVIIQSIDNDIKCDGTDPANEKVFGTKLGAVLDTINAKDRFAQVYLVDQWADVATYAHTIARSHDIVAANAGSGPCDLYSQDYKLRPAAVTYLQKIVDGYYAQVQRVCAAHPRCYTDDAKLQTMKLSLADLAADGNHLAIPGQAKMAALAWAALPAAIKNRA